MNLSPGHAYKPSMETQEDTAAGLLATWKKTHRASIDWTGICKECGWTGLMVGFNECLRCHKRWMLEPMTDETNPASVAARKLDEMCNEAGIGITDGRFRYLLGEYEEDEITGQFVWFQAKRMPASEQQAIQEWLLIKEQLKNKGND